VVSLRPDPTCISDDRSKAETVAPPRPGSCQKDEIRPAARRAIPYLWYLCELSHFCEPLCISLKHAHLADSGRSKTYVRFPARSPFSVCWFQTPRSAKTASVLFRRRVQGFLWLLKLV